MRRYTLDGSDALEGEIRRNLDETVKAALEAVGEESLHALILGGGYGKGEGAVARRGDRDRCYNDFDLFVIVPSGTGRRRRGEIHRRLGQVGHRLAQRFGIDVDFGPPVAVDRLSALPYTQMWMELGEGHRVLWGPEDVLDALPRWDPTRPPLEEGSRLLLNRGAGLLLARQRLTGSLDEAGRSFVLRNVAKAWLACGDAVLFARACYHPGYVERGRRIAAADLSELAEGELLRLRYAEALDFKLRPRIEEPSEGLSARLEEVLAVHRRVFLWYEGRRLGCGMLEGEDYARRPERLAVPSLVDGCANLVRNVLRLGPSVLREPLRAWHHPRDRLLAELPGLLASGGGGGTEAFLRLWQTVN